MVRAREIGLVFLTAAIIFFAAQNLRPVEVIFLFWQFEVSVSLIALVPLLIGLVVGTAGTAIALKRRRRQAEAAALPAASVVDEGRSGGPVREEEEAPD